MLHALCHIRDTDPSQLAVYPGDGPAPSQPEGITVIPYIHEADGRKASDGEPHDPQVNAAVRKGLIRVVPLPPEARNIPTIKEVEQALKKRC